MRHGTIESMTRSLAWHLDFDESDLDALMFEGTRSLMRLCIHYEIVCANFMYHIIVLTPKKGVKGGVVGKTATLEYASLERYELPNNSDQQR